MPTIGFNWPPSPHFRTHPFQDFSENPSDKACMTEWLRSGRLICGASGQQSLATERNGEIILLMIFFLNDIEWHWMTMNVIYDSQCHLWSSMIIHDHLCHFMLIVSGFPRISIIQRIFSRLQKSSTSSHSKNRPADATSNFAKEVNSARVSGADASLGGLTSRAFRGFSVDPLQTMEITPADPPWLPIGGAWKHNSET